MDAIITILKHHLAEDGACPLQSISTPGGGSPTTIDLSFVQDEDVVVTAPPGLPSDKIVLYSFFTSNFPSIEKVC
jgi:hypothetical protein